jgi:hypothetical protein
MKKPEDARAWTDASHSLLSRKKILKLFETNLRAAEAPLPAASAAVNAGAVDSQQREVKDVKRRLTRAGAATLLALAALTPPPQSAQAGDAELRETLKRLGAVLARHGSKVTAGTITTFDARDFRGCKITYELTPNADTGRQGFAPFIERITLDLSALDPERVTVREGQGGRASVSFATRDGGPGIESRRASRPHQFGPASRHPSYYIALRDRAAAEEARELLARAVEQCRR